MNPEDVLRALLAVWDELPLLLGSSWAEIYPRLEALIARLRTAEDLGERASLVADILTTLNVSAEARERFGQALDEVAAATPSTRLGDEGGGKERIGFSAMIEAVQQLVNPTCVIRYTDITAPRRLLLGQRGVMVVGLTRGPEAESEEARPLRVQLRQFLEVYLRSKQGTLFRKIA